MGMIRKSLAISTAGAVKGSSKKQRVAKASLKAQQGVLREMQRANARDLPPIDPGKNGFTDRIRMDKELKARGVSSWMERNQLIAEAVANAATPAPAPVVSPDGRFWWDGSAWQPMPG